MSSELKKKMEKLFVEWSSFSFLLKLCSLQFSEQSGKKKI